MKRLLVWNFLLAVCATAGIYVLHHLWAETQAEEQSVLLRKPASVKTQMPAPPAKPAPFQAVSYSDVAQKTLFAKDRNPNVEVPVPPPPPPPPPMPALPAIYGVMSLPTGVVAMMSDKPGGAQKATREGDTIGEFKVVKLTVNKITLQWNDKTVEKTIDQLLDRATVVASAAPSGGPPSSLAQTPAPAQPSGPPQFGPEVGGAGHSVRTCKQDDSSPAGTVLDGYKKVYRPTPFGQECHWEPSN